MYIIAEYAKQRKQIVDKCEELGKQFIEHFNKTFEMGPEDRWFEHHCEEMQAWLNKVREFKFKSNSKFLNFDQIFNWFFTAGSDIETMTDYEEYYEKLVILLLADKNKTVKEAMTEIFKQGQIE